MREFIRITLALFFYFTGLAAIRAAFKRRKGPLVRVLLVHHIKKPAEFERMIRFLAKRYNPISFDDLVQKRFSEKKINVLLTLDDGYASWLESGLPLLEKYNVPALLFISSGLMEAADFGTGKEFLKENLRLSFPTKPLTREMTQKLARHPLIEIGGHSHTHPFLTALPETGVVQEIALDKKHLESATGKPIRVFAYPFGAYNSLVRKIAGKEYAYAMTTQSDFYSPNSDLLTIPRSNHGTVTNRILSLWVWGAFDFTSFRRKPESRPGPRLSPG